MLLLPFHPLIIVHSCESDALIAILSYRHSSSKKRCPPPSLFLLPLILASPITVFITMNIDPPPSPHVQQEISPNRRRMIELLQLHDEQRRRERQRDDIDRGDDGLLLVVGLFLAVFLFFLVSVANSPPSPPSTTPSRSSLTVQQFGTQWPSNEVQHPSPDERWQWLTPTHEQRLRAQYEEMMATPSWPPSEERAVAVSISPISATHPHSPLAVVTAPFASEEEHPPEEGVVDEEGFSGETRRRDVGSCTHLVSHTHCGWLKECGRRGRCEVTEEHCLGVHLHRTTRLVTTHSSHRAYLSLSRSVVASHPCHHQLPALIPVLFMPVLCPPQVCVRQRLVW
jgi:hypothetical protein